MNKLLSIIIPAYNVEQYLAHGLESLNIPEWRDCIEVLIINDGSKDNTSAIGHDFESRYPGTYRVIEKPNGNYGSCINRGLKEATGTFVKVMDGDDSFDKKGLSVLMAALVNLQEAETEVDVVLTRVDCIDISGKRWPFAVPLGENNDIPVNRPFYLDETHVTEAIAMHMMTYRRKIFKTCEYKQTEGVSYTDMEWRMIPLYFARKLIALPSVVYLYLMGRDGQTMDSAVYARKFNVVADITMHLLDMYNKYHDKAHLRNKAYFKMCMQFQIDMAYIPALCGVRRYDTNIDVVTFDDYIQKYGIEFYYGSRNWKMRLPGPLKIFSFYPVRVWDKWHSVNAPRLFIHRLYKKILRKG